MRPWRLSNVVHELSRSGVLGMTAYPVRGVGVQAGDAALPAYALQILHISSLMYSLEAG